MTSNAYDDFKKALQKSHKNTKIWISWEQNIIISSNKQIHWLHIKGYFIAKNSFVDKVNFKPKKKFKTWDEMKISYNLNHKSCSKWRWIVNLVPQTWGKVLKESQSDCSNLVLFNHQLLKGIRKLSTHIKLNPINIALLLQEARNKKISKTHSLLNKILLSLSACLPFTADCVSF